MNHRLLWLACLAAVSFSLPATAEDGYDLWLRYRAADTREYSALTSGVRELVTVSGSETLKVAQGELARGISGLVGAPVAQVAAPTQTGR